MGPASGSLRRYAACRLCEAGTYRSRALDALPLQPCPPGFSCPQGSESYQGHSCPVGHYCPAGTRSPRPCPAGTFRSSSRARAAEDCRLCPADTFSALPGQVGCLTCQSAAFSPPGECQVCLLQMPCLGPAALRAQDVRFQETATYG
ncbi:signal peptide, CUB and EGF-like domain-containing protein 3 [Homo sapiens]|uniref:signal peptide, CUB and EGF-like domain-containing protein 3 n=1 Tax=Homo sapiens TaxID=9606 RepID=UPI001FB1711B|nr:signal peptide, CUB and EGF-like domain-containing protein 3 [Homo sapiens]XP_047299882.1 signal peptide, CUB and EGF-like domain-containing protein 3 [Homo sapiens]